MKGALVILLAIALVNGQSDGCNEMNCNAVTQTCCPDKQSGPICCIKEETFCCPRENDKASHCCPHWTVCCPGGRFGCCSPDEGWGWDKVTGGGLTTPAAPPTSLSVEEPVQAEKKGATEAFALLVDDSATSSPVEGLHINLNSGAQKSIVMDKSAELAPAGEMTRLFAYSSARNLFALARANFTASAKSQDDPAYPVHVFVVDPATGKTTVVAAAGVTNQVTGYYIDDKTGKMVLATYTFANGDVNGYKFWDVDIDTGAATLRSSSTFGTPDKDDFSGWFHSGSVDGKLVYRLGNQDVVGENDPGMGVTDISTPTATTKFIPAAPLPEGITALITMSNLGQTDEFVSLGTDRHNGLAVLRWSLGGNFTVVASTNTRVPRFFGPVWQATSADATTFAALTVHYGLNPVGAHDKWQLVVVDMTTGKSKVTSMNPDVQAATASLSGIGIPQ